MAADDSQQSTKSKFVLLLDVVRLIFDHYSCRTLSSRRLDGEGHPKGGEKSGQERDRIYKRYRY
jgi:hypothetical protein